jgi:putative tryptophan/tyrosine transport system substrate-binding protein
MNRREFTALVAASSLWPLTVRGQQGRKPLIGFLGSSTSEGYATVVRLIWEGLAKSGYKEGANVAAEFRWADDHVERLPGLAAELVHRNVDVIVTTGGPLPVHAALDATSTIPIVFATGNDPVEGGLLPKFSGSGRNVTGVTFFAAELAPKRLEVMSELLPDARVFAMIMNSRGAGLSRDIDDIQAAAAARGVTMLIVYAAGEGNPDTAFAEIAAKRVQAILVHNDAALYGSIRQIIALSAQHSIPAIYFVGESVKLGGLISYGTYTGDVVRQVGVYVARILKGEKAGELPVQAPTKYELIINLKTAKALGITVPVSLLARADQVIE